MDTKVNKPGRGLQALPRALLGAVLRLIELPWLMLLNLGNHFWNLWIWLGEIRRYYGNGMLMRADLLWMLEYGISSPFAMSRAATREHDLQEDLTVYGETPWTTLEAVCEAAGLTAEEVFVELGAGTGRNLLFIHYRYGARALGYELVPRFVEKFGWLQHHLRLDGIVSLKQQNWFEAELQGDVFFLVGTCYSDANLERATQKLANLPSGTRIVTVSFMLTGPEFALQAEFKADFSWGKGTVYLQRRV